MEKPVRIIPKSIPGRIPVPEKEGKVDQEKVKENIVRVLGRKGTMSASSLKLFTANRETAQDFRAAIDALAGEGKVVTKAGSRPGSLVVALPGATSGFSSNPEKKPEVERPPAKKASATPPIKKSAKAKAPMPAPRKPGGSNGSAIGSAIAELEARRTAALDQVAKIDAVLDSLRVLE